MAANTDFLSAAVYLPRRYELITNDVESIYEGLGLAGLRLDLWGRLLVAAKRGVPQRVEGPSEGLDLGPVANLEDALHRLRRVPADDWGQIALHGRFSIGGFREKVTAVACPLWPLSPTLASAHVLFEKPGLLFEGQSPESRAAHAADAVDRLRRSLCPLAVFLDTEQPIVNVDVLRAGGLPFLPWAGYFSPGALRRLGAGTFRTLPHWVKWLEATVGAEGAAVARPTPGGGLIWVLPQRGLGKGAGPAEAREGLAPWQSYIRRVVA